MQKNIFLCFFLAIFSSSGAFSVEEESKGEAEKNIFNASLWDSKGELSLETRQFKNDRVQSTKDEGLAFTSRLETRYENEGSKIVARGFSRVDKHDRDRDVLILEDAYVSQSFGEEDAFKFLAGYKIFNWSTTEAFHPVEVINSRNYDSNLENLDKIGELTLELEADWLGGQLHFYYWPRYEPPRFPGSKSRLGIGVPIRPAVFVDSDDNPEIDDKKGVQYGARYERKIGTGDIALFYLDHMDRFRPLIGEANFTFVPTVGFVPNSVPNIPYFFRVVETGGSLQYALGPAVMKIEASSRQFQTTRTLFTFSGFKKPADHQEAAAGLEYTKGLESGSDLMFIAEATSYFGVDTPTRADQGPFQRDALVGIRYALNDEAAKEFFTSFIWDLERKHEYFFSAKYNQRVGDSWRAETGVRIYDAPLKGAYPIGLELFDQDNQVYLNFTRFF